MEANNNDITELRTLLFDTMRGLKAGSIDVDKAKAISDIGQVIINSAKVEADHMKVNGSAGTGFIGDGKLAEGALPPGITGIRQYRLR